MTTADQTVSTAEELRAAAARLREKAGNTTLGPWKAGPLVELDDYSRRLEIEVHDRVAERLGVEAGTVAEIRLSLEAAHWPHMCHMAEADGAWIALVNPVLAEPLAAWLDWAAGIARDHPWDPNYDGMPELRWCTYCQDEETSCIQAVDRALAVARVINGGGR